MTNLTAPAVTLQPVSVTRKMAASLPGLRQLAQDRGLKIHHLGAGYPHPEVTDPRDFLTHQQTYFERLAQAEQAQDEGSNERQQTPEYLWIGCADSRVPANQIINLPPGEVFVHRNIANLANPNDMSCLSVLTYAINVLKIEHIILCGHYGCGGVRAVMDSMTNGTDGADGTNGVDGGRHGVLDHWLEPVRTTFKAHYDEIMNIKDIDKRAERLCELNVHSQLASLAQNIVVEDAWRRGQALSLHGWIYSLKDGILHDLDPSLDGI